MQWAAHFAKCSVIPRAFAGTQGRCAVPIRAGSDATEASMAAPNRLQLLRMYKDYPTELSAAAILVGFCLYQFLISLKQGNYFTIAAPFWSFLLLAKVHARAIKDAREYEALEEYAESYDHPADDAVYAQPA